MNTCHEQLDAQSAHSSHLLNHLTEGGRRRIKGAGKKIFDLSFDNTDVQLNIHQCLIIHERSDIIFVFYINSFFLMGCLYALIYFISMSVTMSVSIII